MAEEVRYAVGELAELGGVSRRTVRYYVQEGLLPPPLGIGRGNHYGPEHLQQLLRVRAMQEAGRSLDEIRDALSLRPARQLMRPERVHGSDLELPRTLWRRLELAPGVELHVSSIARLPSQSRMQELASWCRKYLPDGTDERED